MHWLRRLPNIMPCSDDACRLADTLPPAHALSLQDSTMCNIDTGKAAHLGNNVFQDDAAGVCWVPCL